MQNYVDLRIFFGGFILYLYRSIQRIKEDEDVSVYCPDPGDPDQQPVVNEPPVMVL